MDCSGSITRCQQRQWAANFPSVARQSWTDDYFIGSDNFVPEDLIEAHTLVNAQVGWRSESNRWEVIVECKNCFDEKWLANNFFNTIYPADPIRFGVRLKYRSN